MSPKYLPYGNKLDDGKTLPRGLDFDVPSKWQFQKSVFTDGFDW